MKNLVNEFIEFLTKNFALIFSLMVGAFIKAAIDIKTKELKWWERVLNVLISVCVGWIAWRTIKTFDKEAWTGFIVPLATLFGETFAMWLLTNGGNILTRLLDKVIPKKD